jgi:tight adherence protein C
MNSLVLLLAGIAVAGFALAFVAYAFENRRRMVLSRASADPTVARIAPRPLLIAEPSPSRERLRELVSRYLPAGWLETLRREHTLVKAGFDSPMAPVIYAAIQVAALFIFPLIGMALATGGARQVMLFAILGAAVALLLPSYVLVSQTRQRQQRIRRALPDALDLLLVCIEAGSSFDAAVLRVAREMALVHPDLATEFHIAIRKMNHGVAREVALREMWQRSAVDELKPLIANVIQSDRWGTSLGRVLRVAADTLRRKRRQAAEKEAQTASLKMTIPLVLFILPALLLIIMGPTGIAVMGTFNGNGP